MEARPGGVWQFIMRGPDGVNYPNKIAFLEIVKPERLVCEPWEKLSEDGEKSRYGWLKDKFGAAWQVIPNALGELLETKILSKRITSCRQC